MKVTGFTAGFLFAATSLLCSSANADCACFCVNGTLKTLCSSAEEAQANPTLCDLSTPLTCPTEFNGPESATYESPNDASANCRDLRVYDPTRGAFTTIKACDVLSAG